MQVLIIDDDLLFARSLSRRFRAAGHLVEVAGSIAAARATLGNGLRYALVLLDLGLPDGDGAELLPEVRALTDPPRVVVTTGRIVDGQSVVSLYQRGVTHFVPKPLSRQAMDDLCALCSDPIEETIARHAFSEREAQCYRRASRGHNAREIAGALGLAEGSVRTYLARARAKIRNG